MTPLFLKVLNMSINASYLTAVVLLLRLILKRAPKWVNMLLWGGVALRLVCPISIESVLSLIPSAEAVRPDIVLSDRPAVQGGIPTVNTVANPVPEHGYAPSLEQGFTPSPEHSVNPFQIWVLILAAIWLTGLVLLLFYAAFSFYRLNRKIRTAVLLKDNIFQSENISSPFILGIFRPRIFLPFCLPEEALEPVLAHERAHLRRLDYLWKPLGFLLLAIHWFNPLIWLSYVLFCRDIELACDERVIRTLNIKQRADYSQALLVCSTARGSISACPLAFGEAGVKERVKSVLNYKKPSFWVILAAAAVCITTAVCFLTNPAPSDSSSADKKDPAADNSQSPESEGISGTESGENSGYTPADNTPSQSGKTDGQPSEKEDSLLDTILLDNVDLDHDGETELIRVYEEESGGELYFLEVIKQDGTVIFSREAGLPHMGWTSLLLYRESDLDYLIEYNPYMAQGAANYECTVFSLEQGGIAVRYSWTTDFVLPVLELTGKMNAFAEHVNSCLRSSTVLLSTLESELIVGPVSATAVKTVFPVVFDPNELDNAPLYAQMPENGLPADILPLEFMFASGAGGWSTDLTLYPDGSFEGTYGDGEAAFGPEYPNGTSYFCKFKGRFGQITSLNEYSCSMRLEELTYETDTEGEWIEDGVRYIGATAYGLEEGEEFIFYMPYAPAAELDTEFLSWWPEQYLYRDGSIQTLLSYAIRNVNTGEGFFSSWLN